MRLTPITTQPAFSGRKTREAFNQSRIYKIRVKLGDGPVKPWSKFEDDMTAAVKTKKDAVLEHAVYQLLDKIDAQIHDQTSKTYIDHSRDSKPTYVLRGPIFKRLFRNVGKFISIIAAHSTDFNRAVNMDDQISAFARQNKLPFIAAKALIEMRKRNIAPDDMEGSLDKLFAQALATPSPEEEKRRMTNAAVLQIARDNVSDKRYLTFKFTPEGELISVTQKPFKPKK